MGLIDTTKQMFENEFDSDEYIFQYLFVLLQLNYLSNGNKNSIAKSHAFITILPFQLD